VTDETLTPMLAEDRTLPEPLPASRALDRVAHLSADLVVPAVWVALIVAIVLFSGVVTQFRYVDF